MEFMDGSGHPETIHRRTPSPPNFKCYESSASVEFPYRLSLTHSIAVVPARDARRSSVHRRGVVIYSGVSIKLYRFCSSFVVVCVVDS